MEQKYDTLITAIKKIIIENVDMGDQNTLIGVSGAARLIIAAFDTEQNAELAQLRVQLTENDDATEKIKVQLADAQSKFLMIINLGELDFEGEPYSCDLQDAIIIAQGALAEAK